MEKALLLFASKSGYARRAINLKKVPPELALGHQPLAILLADFLLGGHSQSARRIRAASSRATPPISSDRLGAFDQLRPVVPSR